MTMTAGEKIATNIKAGPESGLAEGEAQAMFSVYDVVDSDGDRVKEGEWDGFVAEIKAQERVVPVLFAHDHRNPMMCIGEAVEFDPAAENSKGQRGITAKVKFDIDGDNPNPNAVQAYKLAKGRRVNQWSYHYHAERVKGADGVNDLKNISATELSLVLRGANDQTATLDIKEAKATLAAGKPEHLKSYVDVDVPGSFEATQAALQATLGRKYPSPVDGTGYVYVNLVATTSDQVTYQLINETSEGRSEQLLQADYAIADGAVELGEAAEVGVTIAAKGAPGDSGSVLEAELDIARAKILAGTTLL